MKIEKFLAVIFLFTLYLESHSQQILSSFPIEQSNFQTTDICKDKNGHTFVSGHFGVAKYNKGGQVIWSRKIGYPEGSLRDMDIDEEGNVYVCGRVSNYPVSFEGTATTIAPENNYRVGYLIKYSKDGIFLWVKKISSTGGHVHCSNIAIDKNGVIYMTGTGSGSLYIQSIKAATMGTDDIFILTLNTDGNYLWAKSAGGTGVDSGTVIECDDFNNAYVGGYYSGTALFGSTSLTALGRRDAFLLKVNSFGFSWVKTPPSGVDDDEINTIKLSKNNDIYIGGKTDYGLILEKYSNSGTRLWFEYQVGSANIVNDLDLDADENIIVTGQFKGRVSFGGIILESSKGDLINYSENGFIAKYSSSGNIIWASIIKLKNEVFEFSEMGTDVATDMNGNIFLITNGSNILYIIADASFPHNVIEGKIINDFNKDCSNTSENGMQGIIVVAEPGPFYGSTNITGDFDIKTGIGSFKISQYPVNTAERVSQICPQLQGFHTSSFASTGQKDINNNFYNSIKECYNLTVDIHSNRRRRCLRNYTKVEYCNTGIIAANNAELEVIFPEFTIPLSSTIPWTEKNGQKIIFSLGSVAPGTCEQITIIDSVACIFGITGLAQCTEAYITPKNDCFEINPAWDESSLTVTGECMDTLITFNILNSGQGNMSDSSDYRLYENNVLIYNRKLKLLINEQITLSIPSKGNTYRLEVDQVNYYPYLSKPEQTVEACGTTYYNASKGYASGKYEDDEDYQMESSCLPIIDSYDPNSKTVKPLGITSKKYISAADEMEYAINFQNLGTDTAFNIVIEDLLNFNLDPLTIVPGISSHHYTWKLEGYFPKLIFEFKKINLPICSKGVCDGFVKFKIKQKKGNGNGTLIKNSASIFFDYNPAIITNETVNMVYDTTITDYTKGAQVLIKNEMITLIHNINKSKPTVYPNPVDNTLTINLQETLTNKGNVSVRVINTLGDEVFHTFFQPNGKLLQIPFENVMEGLYFIELWDDTTKLFGTKIIKIQSKP